jgi:hypothetical protein
MTSAFRPARLVFGLMSAIAALPQEAPAAVALGHDKAKPESEGKGIVVPRQRHAGGCNSAGCRTLDRCLCACKACKLACNGQG